jgi:superfamily II DNA/RNA helicase
VEEEDRKIIIFSEWTSMLDLVEPQLEELDVSFVRLDGKIPQIKRKTIIKKFTDNPEVRIFLTTNAGSTGLNLQAADTIINLDLPWNPALLEQRIGRAHRIGQTKTVQVFLLVTAETIEERLLDLLGAKSALALATLDLKNDTDFVEMSAGIDALKNRLEILLGQRPDKPMETVRPAEEQKLQERRQKISEAGGKLLNAVCDFLGELLPPQKEDVKEAKNGNGSIPPDDNTEKETKDNPINDIKDFFLNCIQKDEEGRTHFTLPLPDDTVINKIADTLGRFLGGRF